MAGAGHNGIMRAERPQLLAGAKFTLLDSVHALCYDGGPQLESNLRTQGEDPLATTEERIRKLVDDNLDIEGRPAGRPLDLNASLRDSGVSSVDFVAFAKIVAQEFDVSFTLEDCAKYGSVGELIEYLDSRSG